MPGLVVRQSLKGQFMLVEAASGAVHFLLERQVRMPARPFLGVSDGDAEEVVRVVGEHLERAWRPG